MTELSDHEIMQMIGRAGRPQFDDKGVAVILTRSDKRPKYENLVAGKVPLESRLHLQLTEHINAEIGLGTITDLETAKMWLRSTFFFVRCRVNPTLYGLDTHPDSVEKMVENMCVHNLKRLQDATLVENCNGKVHLTAFGEAAAKYCVRIQTTELIVGMKDQAKLKHTVGVFLSRFLTAQLETLCKAEEFKGLRIRAGEKGFYNSVVNQNYSIRYPFKGAKGSQPVDEVWQKVSLLLQVRYSDVSLKFSLNSVSPILESMRKRRN